MSLIEGNDRQTVKRTVSKQSNKIHAAGVAKLYVAYPNRQRWTFTGLQGAAVLANDLVGNTYWIKLVDLSPANRGVIWDQEIYDTFQYNQDRVFFHSFELEDCMAGLSFASDKEAKKFKQKVDEREKNAHKNTRSKPFSNAAGQSAGGATTNGNTKSHGILGGFGSLLHRDRHSSTPQQQQPQSIIPPSNVSVKPATNDIKGPATNNIDPALLDELLAMGITEDQLAQNADFIQMWIAQKQATPTTSEPRQKAPPPPPEISPQHSGSGQKRGPAPALPPARRGARPDGLDREASSSSAREGSPAGGAAKRWNFKAPPPLAGAGKFAEDAKLPPSLPSRARGSSNAAQPGPPPPPRPAKTPMDDTESPKFGVPPPLGQERLVPPPPPSRGSAPSLPSRGSAPPPPPPRDHYPTHAVPPAAIAPPPLPPKVPHASSPPPPPSRDHQKAVPPPLPPSRDHHSPSHAAPTSDNEDEYDPYRYDSSAASRGPPAPPPPPPARDSRPGPQPPPRTPHSRDTSREVPSIPQPPPRTLHSRDASREVPPVPSASHSRHPSFEPPPPPRPASHSPQPSTAPPPPPPIPSGSGPPPPPPMPSSSGPPPPPPMPKGSGPPPPPPMPSGSGPPPPPAMPSGSGPPPPPPMPNREPDGLESATANAPAVSTGEGGRDNLMASIRGGARLKKVSDTEKRDRSEAAVPGGGGGGGGSAAAASSAAPAGGDQGGLAGALASALAARKSKVSASDDEDDKDDW